MKYPAIYRTRQGANYLYASKDSYYSYTLKDWGESTFTDINEHANDKNITAEYLANTYCEVKNKEHAKFIVKLALVNGKNNFSTIFLDEAKSFVFDMVGDLKLYKARPSELSSVSNLKQITIPLPPECESGPFKNVNADNIETMKFDIPGNTSEFDAIASSKSVGMSEYFSDAAGAAKALNIEIDGKPVKPKRRNKSKQAYDILKSLDYEYDLVKQRWYRKQYID